MTRRHQLARRALIAGLAVLLTLSGAAAATADESIDPQAEALNFSKTTERLRYVSLTPKFQALRLRAESRRALQELQIRLRDRGRNFEGNLCGHRFDGCAGDVRLYDWVRAGHGIALPILFTARNGSTISGHVWATAAGPASRPAVVITNGSVQAPEEAYWFAAQTLAKAGYVVMTWDPQGQGYSDTFGAGPDLLDGAPSQGGRPFYDGTEDALDFLLSTPADRYDPRPSCTSGTDHSAKQDRRAASGKVSAYNPLHGLLDPERVGLVGHSLGAAAVSYIGQLDPRVDAVVAYDALHGSSRPPLFDGVLTCRSGSSARPEHVSLRTPALGLSPDYSFVPTPFLSRPDSEAPSGAAKEYAAAGIDTGQLVIRGGTHFDFSFIPSVANAVFPATLRGMDLAAWYTTAWMDAHLKDDPGAEARLFTDRWRHDIAGAAVDPTRDGNLFSSYYRSWISVAGHACNDLRTGDCDLVPDGLGAYSAVDVARSPDTATGPGRDAARPWIVSADPAGANGVPPAGR